MLDLLIVDDNKDDIHLVTTLIGAANYGIEVRVSAATSLAEAIEVSTHIKPQLTFLDLNLEGSTIDEVLAAINKLHYPVIVCTGYPSQYYRSGQTIPLIQEVFKAGAQDFVEKSTQRFKQLETIMLRTLVRLYSSKPSDAYGR